jgi:Pol polyprotein, beta-barrel domain
MVAKISEVKITPADTIILSAGSTEPSIYEEDRIIWLIDSAASSHISGNKDLFHPMHNIAPVKINIANGESFSVNQTGTIRIKITSDPQWGVPEVPITLTDVIYAPKLKSNLISVGHMTSSDVSVYFGKYRSWMSPGGKIIAYGPKDNNLYSYIGYPIPLMNETADYVSEPSEPMLWHHRLAQASHHALQA